MSLLQGYFGHSSKCFKMLLIVDMLKFKVFIFNLLYCVHISYEILHPDSEAASFKGCIQRENASQWGNEGCPNLKDPSNAPYKCLLLFSRPRSIQPLP